MESRCSSRVASQKPKYPLCFWHSTGNYGLLTMTVIITARCLDNIHFKDVYDSLTALQRMMIGTVFCTFLLLNGSVKPETKTRKASHNEGAGRSVRLPNNLNKLDTCWKKWKLNVRHWLLKCFEYLLKNYTDKSIKLKSWYKSVPLSLEVRHVWTHLPKSTDRSSEAETLKSTRSFWTHRAICTQAGIPKLVKLFTQTQLVFALTGDSCNTASLNSVKPNSFTGRLKRRLYIYTYTHCI